VRPTSPRTRAGEVETLIEAARGNRYGHRDATMVLLTYRHGLRAAEVCDLRWEQVDFSGAMLHVRRVKNGSRARTRSRATNCRHCVGYSARARVVAARPGFQDGETREGESVSPGLTDLASRDPAGILTP
jgi:integrase